MFQNIFISWTSKGRGRGGEKVQDGIEIMMKKENEEKNEKDGKEEKYGKGEKKENNGKGKKAKSSSFGTSRIEDILQAKFI